MNAVIGWLIGIFSMVIALVIVDVFISSSRVSKIVKSVCSIAILLVIVAPLPKMLKVENGMNDNLSTEFSYALDENYLNYVTDAKIDVIETSVERELDEKYCKGIEVDVRYVKNNGEIEIEKVYLNFSKCVINENGENINRNEVRVFVAKKLNVATEIVSEYG